MVLAAGDTDIVPAVANPLPTPWSIWMLVALVTFHINMVDCPLPIVAGIAVNATIPGLLPSPDCQKHDVTSSNKGNKNNNFFKIRLPIIDIHEYKNPS